MDIHILAIGRKSRGWAADAEADYMARMVPWQKVVVHVLPPEDENVLGRDKATQKENEKLCAQIPKGVYVVACDRRGKMRTSEDFARAVDIVGRDIWFVIGGSHGLLPIVLDRAQEMVSFGMITLPHELFRVVLLEQLYRAGQILKGTKYHK